MASLLPAVVLLVLICGILPPFVSAHNDCIQYTTSSGRFEPYEKCYFGFCCGDCYSKQCCNNIHLRFEEDSQEDCEYPRLLDNSPVLGSVIGGVIFVVVVLISCCVCPCCCLYKICRKPRPVIATTTHTTIVANTPQHYPQQPVMTPGQPQPYQGGSYPAYQPVPVQTGYGGQPSLPQGYPPQPMPAMPHPVQPFTAGPPPTYLEATGPVYPPNPMPYSQAAFTPGQQSYPMQPPVQPQANAPAAQIGYLAQPAYNPDFVSQPPKMG
ncbi:protein shisa-4-like [Stigmatopora nigra]